MISNPTCIPRNIAATVALLGLLHLPLFAAAIPDRPEQLKYPPFQYEPPKAADYRVVLKNGVVVYLVPDRERPLLTVTVHVRIGEYAVPPGKEGLSDLVGYLLTHSGTRSKKAEDLEERLAFLAAHLESNIGEVMSGVRLNLLSKDADEGLAILREVLTEPRFQEDKVALQKQRLLQAMKERNDESENIESRENGFLVWGDDFFINKHATQESLNSITIADLVVFHRDWFHPENFLVSVSGTFDKETMIAKLESFFNDWPYKGKSSPKVPQNHKMASPGLYIVNKEVNQGRVGIMLPGLMRTDPDIHTAQVMNYILGGGGFTSRIMSRVRSDEGLAYSAGSMLVPGIYYSGYFRAAFQTKSRTVAYASSIVLEEINRIAKTPVSDQELETAKNSLIETFPRRFSTKDQVASSLADEELSGRYKSDPEFFKNYRSHIAKTTKEDVIRVAARLFDTNKIVMLVVGQKGDILNADPKYPVSITNLASGKVIDVPLRDPLTMQPMK